MARNPSRSETPSRRTDSREPARRGVDDPGDSDDAAFEAGRAVAAVVLGLGLKSVDLRRNHLSDGTIVREGSTITRQWDFAEVSAKGEEAAMPHVVKAMSGWLAEAAVNPHLTRHEHAAQLACFEAFMFAAPAVCPGLYAICGELRDGGGDMRTFSEEVRPNEDRILKLCIAGRDAAYRLILDHLEAIERVAALLLEGKELTGEEVAAIVERSRAGSD
jgi:hypothetical protein